MRSAPARLACGISSAVRVSVDPIQRHSRADGVQSRAIEQRGVFQGEEVGVVMKALVLGFDTEYDYLGLSEGWSKEKNVGFGLQALELITSHLREFNAPATFFLVGEY